MYDEDSLPELEFSQSNLDAQAAWLEAGEQAARVKAEKQAARERAKTQAAQAQPQQVETCNPPVDPAWHSEVHLQPSRAVGGAPGKLEAPDSEVSTLPRRRQVSAISASSCNSAAAQDILPAPRANMNCGGSEAVKVTAGSAAITTAEGSIDNSSADADSIVTTQGASCEQADWEEALKRQVAVKREEEELRCRAEEQEEEDEYIRSGAADEARLEREQYTKLVIEQEQRDEERQREQAEHVAAEAEAAAKAKAEADALEKKKRVYQEAARKRQARVNPHAIADKWSN